jgi:hypothetical protein
MTELKTKTVRYLSTEHYNIESHEGDHGFMEITISFPRSNHKSFLMLLGCAKIYELTDETSPCPYSKFSPYMTVNRLNNYIYLEIKICLWKDRDGEQKLQELISITENLY